jgi:hypothetical protein
MLKRLDATLWCDLPPTTDGIANQTCPLFLFLTRFNAHNSIWLIVGIPDAGQIVPVGIL